MLSTQLGILSDTSSTYTILTVASTAVFYFLPVLLAYTASKTFECDSYVAVAVMGALMMPDFINLMGDVGNGAVSSFMGIPVVLMTYSSTVIPAVLSIYVLSKLEKLLNKIIPTTVQLCFVPLISLLVMVPLTAMAIGPVGVYLGTGIATVITKLVNFNGWLAGAVMGGGWNILVILGIHWAVNPIMIQNVSVAGFDYMVPLTCATNFGVAGATLGTFLKTKDEKMKQFSLSAILSIFFAGITEPANYGVCVKYKKPLVAAFIGGAAGGAFMGGMKVKAFAFVFGGLTTIPAFAGPTLIYYVIGLAICFFVSFAIMMVIGIEEENVENIENKNIDEVISLPVAGEVKDLATCSDKTFASGQLGEGAVILPSEGVVYAPFDGTMEMIFDTLHAFNMKSDHGTSLFVHVGLDTVELAGKPFKVFVKKGQHVKQGQKIMEFDMDQIKKAGKSTEVILLVDNAENVSLQSVGKMQKGDKFLSVRA